MEHIPVPDITLLFIPSVYAIRKEVWIYEDLLKIASFFGTTSLFDSFSCLYSVNEGRVCYAASHFVTKYSNNQFI